MTRCHFTFERTAALAVGLAAAFVLGASTLQAQSKSGVDSSVSGAAAAAATEEAPYSYYYQGKLVVLVPNPELVAIRGPATGLAATSAAAMALAGQQGWVLDARSSRNALVAHGLTLYRAAVARGKGFAALTSAEMPLSKALAAGTVAQPVFELGGAVQIPSDEVIVGFAESTDLNTAHAFVEQHAAALGLVTARPLMANTLLITIEHEENGRAFAVSRALARLPGIAFAEPNCVVLFEDTPQAPLPLTGWLGPADFSERPPRAPFSGTSTAPQLAAAAPGWTTVLADDFEGNAIAWQFGNGSGKTPAQPAYTTNRAHSGTHSIYMTGGGPLGVLPPGPYPGGCDALLSSPVLDLSPFEEVYVELWFWEKVEAPGSDQTGNAQYYDYGAVFVLDPATSHFDGRRLAAAYTGDLTADPTAANGWRRALIRVPPEFRKGGVQVVVQFVSDSSVGDEGLYIDDVRVVGTANVDTEHISNDPYSGRQYELKNVGQVAGLGNDDNDLNVPEAWAEVTIDPNLVVAVIDSGVDLGHPEFNLVTGYDGDTRLVGGGPRGGTDEDAHGTACAGNVGAIKDNGIGVVGTAPGVKIMPINRASTFADIANGIDLAVTHGAKVLSNSWGGSSPSTVVTQAFQNALDAGSVVVIAAGNGPSRPPYNYETQFPCNLTAQIDVICVGASSPTDEYKGVSSSDGECWWGSSYIGAGPDVVAPSSWSYTTDLRGSNGLNSDASVSGVDTDYTYNFNGTSSSTPKVAGIVALMLSKNPALTPAQVKGILMDTAKDIDAPGFDDKTGAGRVDALAAVRAAGNVMTTTPTRTPVPGVTPTSLGTVTPTAPVAPTSRSASPTPSATRTAGQAACTSASFEAHRDFAVGPLPQSAALGDFNGDGNLDLAVANNGGVGVTGAETVSVLLGTGSGNLGAATNFGVGQGSYKCVAVGDFNGDGNPDLAVINDWDENVSILLGTGSGSFGPARDFSARGGDVGGGGTEEGESLVVGDFNGDGIPDLAVAQYFGTVSILLGMGDGSFGAPTDFKAGDYPTSLAVGDFNADGKEDLAVVRHNCAQKFLCNGMTSDESFVSILLGSGDGSFDAPTDFSLGASPFGSYPKSVAVGDFNGDGKLDLAVAGYQDGTIDALVGTGDGSFGPPSSFPAGSNPRSVAVGDFNGDGNLDLAVASADSNTVSVLFGMGSGSFGAPTSFVTASPPSSGDHRGEGSLVVGDFNGDGAPDLAVANYWGVGTVSILLNTCPAASHSPTPSSTATPVQTPTVTRTAAPTHTPTQTATPPPTRTHTPTPTSTSPPGCFSARKEFTVGFYPYSVAVGDFDSDGNPDLAVANNWGGTVSILLGTGGGSFGPATNFTVGSSPRSVGVGDFNGDGKPDLAVANYGDGIAVLLGTGTGSFGAASNFAAGGSPSSVAVDDFNGDGKLDLAVANAGSGTVSILLGTGSGSFGPATNFTVGWSPSFVAVGDFNGDGKPDLAVANYLSNTVSILLGTGSGSFGAASDFAVGLNPSSLAMGDFNGDGALDLAVANYSAPSVSILLGTGSGSFSAATNIGVGGSPPSVALGDFNGDGTPDLAVANGASNAVSVLFGRGSGSFEAPIQFAVGMGAQSVAVADLNGDGTPDLAVANNGSSTVSVLLNMCPGAPPPTNIPTHTPLAPDTPSVTPTQTSTVTWSATATWTWTLIGTPTQVPTATNTATMTERNTATVTRTEPPTVTPTTSAEPTAPVVPTPTLTNTATHTPPNAITPTETLTPTPQPATPTPTTAPILTTCAGDCNGDGQVTVDEIVTMANMALGRPVPSGCAAGDPNGDGKCTIDEIVAAVNNALSACPGRSTALTTVAGGKTHD